MNDPLAGCDTYDLLGGMSMSVQSATVYGAPNFNPGATRDYHNEHVARIVELEAEVALLRKQLALAELENLCFRMASAQAARVGGVGEFP